ncbi:Uncharacterized protein Fot_22242 [Forsythia ovata]|uniref:Uncharacterized protein n=1 Tax=Forsythia ovata TaxID=205694 RepID=A0ABD1UXI5_9LAMI
MEYTRIRFINFSIAPTGYGAVVKYEGFSTEYRMFESPRQLEVNFKNKIVGRQRSTMKENRRMSGPIVYKLVTAFRIYLSGEPRGEGRHFSELVGTKLRHLSYQKKKKNGIHKILGLDTQMDGD